MCFFFVFCFQAEDGIRDLVRSRGLGDVYKRQLQDVAVHLELDAGQVVDDVREPGADQLRVAHGAVLSLIHI